MQTGRDPPLLYLHRSALRQDSCSHTYRVVRCSLAASAPAPNNGNDSGIPRGPTNSLEHATCWPLSMQTAYLTRGPVKLMISCFICDSSCGGPWCPLDCIHRDLHSELGDEVPPPWFITTPLHEHTSDCVRLAQIDLKPLKITVVWPRRPRCGRV